jgi:hypothetical protein
MVRLKSGCQSASTGRPKSALILKMPLRSLARNFLFGFQLGGLIGLGFWMLIIAAYDRMIRIAISQAAFEAIARTLPLGSAGYENPVNEHGERYVCSTGRLSTGSARCAGQARAIATPSCACSPAQRAA